MEIKLEQVHKDLMWKINDGGNMETRLRQVRVGIEQELSASSFKIGEIISNRVDGIRKKMDNEAFKMNERLDKIISQHQKPSKTDR